MGDILGTVKLMELTMIVFGLVCVGLSAILSYKFHRIKQVLSKALAYQLLAESIVGFVTVLFAVTSWLDLYSTLSPEIVLVMRLVIFLAAASTSVNLYRKVRMLEKSTDEDDK